MFHPFFSFLSGTQYKTIVEYAPSQRVPKNWSKNDGREGTILKGNILLACWAPHKFYLCMKVVSDVDCI